jgi:hypothetical protein
MSIINMTMDSPQAVEDRARKIFGELVHGLDFRQDALGARLVDLIGIAQVERNRLEIDPRGRPWRPNEPGYKRWKGGLPVGVLSGSMLEQGNIYGRDTIGQDEVKIEYAGSPEDVQKMIWFSGGSGRNRIGQFQSQRIAWGLDRNIERAMSNEINVWLNRLMNRITS